MSRHLPLQNAATDQIMAGCQAEAVAERSHETGHCLELFRRALDEQDEAAWHFVQTQYRQLLISWFSQFAGRPLGPDELDDLVQNTFIRLWRTLTRDPNTIRRQFAHIGAVLHYLRRCAASIHLEQQRQLERQRRLTAALAAEELLDQAVDLSAKQLANARLAQIRAFITASLTDEVERLVYQLSFSENLKPAEIAARHPEHFATAADVYRLKTRILKRARRALRD